MLVGYGIIRHRGSAERGLGVGRGGCVDTHGPEDRALFESASTQLYEEIVASGGIVAGEPRLESGGQFHDALEQLRRMGLVRLVRGHSCLPVPPCPSTTR